MDKFAVRLVIRLAILACLVLLAWFAKPAQAQVVNQTWNVGSTQYKGNFLLSGLTYPGGDRGEAGLRIIYLDSFEYVPLTNYTYTVEGGHETAGEHGATTTSLLNRWNLEYHLFFSGGLSQLDSATMVITSPLGNVVSMPIFNMFLASNDNVTGPQPWPMGDSQNPAYFIQDSVNPSNPPWFTMPFNPDAYGIYTVDLDLRKGTVNLDQYMEVDVVPAPSSAVLLGLGGLLVSRRRRHRRL